MKWGLCNRRGILVVTTVRNTLTPDVEVQITRGEVTFCEEAAGSCTSPRWACCAPHVTFHRRWDCRRERLRLREAPPSVLDAGLGGLAERLGMLVTVPLGL